MLLLLQRQQTFDMKVHGEERSEIMMRSCTITYTTGTQQSLEWETSHEQTTTRLSAASSTLSYVSD